LYHDLLGIVGIILKYITPLTVAPAIAMIGLSLFKVSAVHGMPILLLDGLFIFCHNYIMVLEFSASTNWGIALL
jgi:hypothetical protein